MNLTTAQIFEKVGDFEGIEVSITEDYSGRGMYGKTTVGIVIESKDDIFKLLASLIDPSADIDFFVNQIESCDDSDDWKEFLTSDISELKSDSMGYSTIYY